MSERKIAIDFDGVLHRYSRGWNGGIIYDEPVKGTREALEWLKDQGYIIYIYTGRTNSEFRHQGEDDQAKAIERWLNKYNIPYDKVWLDGKPAAHIYLDDRAIRFNGDWKEILGSIENSEPWWKKLQDN